MFGRAMPIQRAQLVVADAFVTRAHRIRKMVIAVFGAAAVVVFETTVREHVA